MVRNLVDVSDIQSYTIHNQLVAKIAKMCGMVNHGIVTYSGSESNEVALGLAKKITNRNKILASNISHSSIQNSARKLGMELIVIDVEPETLEIDKSRLEYTIDKHAEDLAASLSTIRTLEPDVVLCSASVGAISVVEVTKVEWHDAIDSNINKLGRA